MFYACAVYVIYNFLFSAFFMHAFFCNAKTQTSQPPPQPERLLNYMWVFFFQLYSDILTHLPLAMILVPIASRRRELERKISPQSQHKGLNKLLPARTKRSPPQPCTHLPTQLASSLLLTNMHSLNIFVGPLEKEKEIRKHNFTHLKKQFYSCLYWSQCTRYLKPYHQACFLSYYGRFGIVVVYFWPKLNFMLFSLRCTY